MLLAMCILRRSLFHVILNGSYYRDSLEEHRNVQGKENWRAAARELRLLPATIWVRMEGLVRSHLQKCLTITEFRWPIMLKR
jgi:hypothetical protein